MAAQRPRTRAWFRRMKLGMRGEKRRNGGKQIAVFELDVGAALADERNHGRLEEIDRNVEARRQKTDFHDSVELDLGDASGNQVVYVAMCQSWELLEPIADDLLVSQIHDPTVLTAQLLHRLFDVRNIDINGILLIIGTLCAYLQFLVSYTTIMSIDFFQYLCFQLLPREVFTNSRSGTTIKTKTAKLLQKIDHSFLCDLFYDFHNVSLRELVRHVSILSILQFLHQ